MHGFSTVRCVDKAGFGTEVFELSIPEGWVFFGGMEWSEDPTFAVHGNFAAASPDGGLGIQFFPEYASAWTDDEGVRRSMPPSPFVRVAPPPTVTGALKEWIVRQFRQGVQSLEILTEDDLGSPPNMPISDRGGTDAWGGAMPAMPRMGRVRVRYLLQGKPVEEEFWGQLTVNQIQPVPGGMPFPYTYCVLNMTISYRAPAGELDGNLNMLWSIQSSYRPNQGYFEHLRRTFQLDPAIFQGQDQGRVRAAMQQHQMTVMRTIGEYSGRWNQLVQNARRQESPANDPLSVVGTALGYPPDARLLGTIDAPPPAFAPQPASSPTPPPTAFVPGPGTPAPQSTPPAAFCPACGVRTSPGGRFCTACGTRLASSASAPSPEPSPTPVAPQVPPAPPQGFPGQAPAGNAPVGGPITCSRCQALMPPGSATCFFCGAPL
jgi:hypothetical protein